MTIQTTAKQMTLLFVALGMLVAATQCSKAATTCRVSKVHYDALDISLKIPYDVIVKAFGCEGEELTSMMMGRTKFRSVQWDGRSGFLMLTFQNNILVTKMQAGLK